MRNKKNQLMVVAALVSIFLLFVPEQASAQLFRRWQEDNPRDNYSHLPGADARATRAPDYGVERVSEDIRNEVNGRAPVTPAPDFFSDAPLARAAKQYQNPVSYVTQRPIGEGNRVQPPMTSHADRVAALPYWIGSSGEDSASDAGNFPPVLTEKALVADFIEATASQVTSGTDRGGDKQETPAEPVEAAGDHAAAADDAEKAEVPVIAENPPETKKDVLPSAEVPGRQDAKPKPDGIRVPALSLGTMLLWQVFF